MSIDFYKQLPVIRSFEEITNPDIYTPIPEDWYVLVADVVGSRKAINEGKYKEVNTIGASCIVAVLNALDTLDLPYVFGGDGASICIPPQYLEKSINALLGAKNMAIVAFSLELRIGSIPIKAILDEGGRVDVAKMKLSKHYNQAVFSGGGIAIADRLLKAQDSPYLISSKDQKIAADFTGLECRWDRVAQDGKQVISLLVKSKKEDQGSVSEYERIIKQIEQLVHSDHPITEKALKFSFNPRWLKNEYRPRTLIKNYFQRLKYIFDLYYRIIIGKFLMRFSIKTGEYNWGDYKQELIVNSDYKKFDDMLRVIISCTEEETEALIKYLDDLEQEGNFTYGIHISEAAIVTCMIKEYSGLHFHFVDGDNGGYAMAAIHMASKM